MTLVTPGPNAWVSYRSYQVVLCYQTAGPWSMKRGEAE